MRYVMVIDAAQGERKDADSFAAAVAHEEQRGAVRIGVQDALFEAIPPFSPSAVIADHIAPLAHRYHVTRVHGDAHAKGFVAELLREHGLTFVPLERDKSALYLDALAMLNSGRARLLDHLKQRRQILSLRRSLHSGGRVNVDAARGGHEDCANVGLAALVVALGLQTKNTRKRVFIAMAGEHTSFRYDSANATLASAPDARTERERKQHAQMLALIKYTNEKLERQAERDRVLEGLTEGECSAPVFGSSATDALKRALHA